MAKVPDRYKLVDFGVNVYVVYLETSLVSAMTAIVLKIAMI